MRRWGLVVVSMCLADAAWAAKGDVCSGTRVETDKFTGGSNTRAMIQPLTMVTAVQIELVGQSGGAELDLLIKEGGAIDGGLRAGTEVPIALTDGSVLMLQTVRDAPTQSYVSGDSIFTNVSYPLGLSPAQVHQLATTPLNAIRLSVQGQNLDWTAGKGVQAKLQAAAQCLEQMAGGAAAAAPAAAPAPAPAAAPAATPAPTP